MAEVTCLLERLDDPEQVEAVSMDMSLTFREAVRWCLPRAQIVADHFHVVQHVGKALARVWRRCAQTTAGRAALRGRRHLFVRRAEALEPDEEQARATLAAAFPDLAAAWQAKEDLRAWYASATAQTAADGLDAWVATVTQAGPDESAPHAERLYDLAQRDSGLLRLLTPAPEQRLCRGQEQPDQGAHASGLWLSQSPLPTRAHLGRRPLIVSSPSKTETRLLTSAAPVAILAPGGPLAHKVCLRWPTFRRPWTRAGGSRGGHSRLQTRREPPASLQKCDG